MQTLRLTLTLFAVAALAGVSGCGQPCRAVSEARALAFSCDPIATFRGELHFDSAATFETFLVQECLPPADAESEAAELVDQVDFTQDAIFVASGNSTIGQRCILERRFATCDVCDDGLKISFDDVETDTSAGCPVASWTVGVVLPRDELRAALEAGDLAEQELLNR